MAVLVGSRCNWAHETCHRLEGIARQAFHLGVIARGGVKSVKLLSIRLSGEMPSEMSLLICPSVERAIVPRLLSSNDRRRLGESLAKGGTVETF